MYLFLCRYAIIGDTNSRSYFDIDPVTGEITAKVSFDYEERSSYTLIVKASNPHSANFETTVRVKINVKGVNEFPPKFIQVMRIILKIIIILITVQCETKQPCECKYQIRY